MIRSFGTKVYKKRSIHQNSRHKKSLRTLSLNLHSFSIHKMTKQTKMHVSYKNHLYSSHSLSKSATYTISSLHLSSTTIPFTVSSSTLSSSSTHIDPTYAVSNDSNDDSKKQDASVNTGSVTCPAVGTEDRIITNPILDQNSISTNDNLPIRPAQIIILVIGLFAGIAFIITAMFLIYRKNNKKTKSNRGSKDGSHDKSKHDQENGSDFIPELVIAPSKKAADVQRELKEEDDKNRLVNDLSSTSGTLVDDRISGQSSFKREYMDHNRLQRDSWQTFVTCETAITEEVKDEERIVVNHSMPIMKAKRRKVPVYQAQLAHPLLIY